MLHTQARFEKNESQKPDFDAQLRLFRGVVITAAGLFAGTVLGGVVGLFVYANSRIPNVHDVIFAAIQTLGVILGLAMGYLAARSAEAQERFVDAAQRAGAALLKKYRPKPGTAGHSNIGQRSISQASSSQRAPRTASSAIAGEDFLKTLIGGKG